MNTPLISIIVPTYNSESTIIECIRSLVKQTYPNKEIVIINDNSTDATLKKINQYFSNYSYIKVHTIKHGGISKARNTGILKSKGKYLTFVDPDDIVHDDYVEYMFNLIVKYGTKISSCQHTIYFENGTVKSNKLPVNESVLGSHDWLKYVLIRDKIDLSAWAKLYDRSLFYGIKYPEGKIFEDTAVTYRIILKSKKIAIGGKSKYNYIIRRNSITTSDFNLSKLDLISTTESMSNEIIDKYPDLYDATRLRLSWSYVSVLNSVLLNNNYKKYRELSRDLRKRILRNRRIINSDLNPDKRLVLSAFFLLFGVWFYRVSLKIHFHKKNF
ncbi:glycosyltransferase family 2 protein [Companilactobacillus alimentarius]